MVNKKIVLLTDPN